MKNIKIRGVNLGGWLVLERWIKPSLFEGTTAQDELSLLIDLKDVAEKRIVKHREEFITEKDIKWLADIGINAIRVPYGHWVFGDGYPYHHKYKKIDYPYVAGSIDYLDKALDWAEKYGLEVVLDLHAAPGCQNGFDNGGIFHTCDWHKKEEYIDFTIDVLRKIAKRYVDRKNIITLSLLNEPSWDISTKVLEDFSLRAMDKVWEISKYDIMFHEGFRNHKEWKNFVSKRDKCKIFYDIHRYQCFQTEDMNRNIFSHINKPVTVLVEEAKIIKEELGIKTFVGEWSLGLDPKIVPVLFDVKTDSHAYMGLDSMQAEAARKAFGSAQLLAYDSFDGWFFWTFRTETQPEWSFEECVKRAWLPNRF